MARIGKSIPIIVIQEAGLDGFWVHRILEKGGIESHVADPASIATSRRQRRVKTDRVDGETLLRTLMAYKRGDLVRKPQVSWKRARTWTGVSCRNKLHPLTRNVPM
jgi:transposase